MVINWKIVSIFAIFAVVLSMLGGLIGGVDFGEVILRSIIWGVIFAGVGLGIQVLMDNFLPELADALYGTPKSPQVEKEEDGSSEVDEILPEINPHSSGAQSADEEESFESGQTEALSGGEEMAGVSRLKEGMTTDVPDRGSKSNSEDSEDFEDSDAGGKNADDLDTLPDLDSFAGSFSDFGGEISPDANVMADGTKESVEIAGEQQDPTKVAKAIHTWMERDKKEG